MISPKNALALSNTAMLSVNEDIDKILETIISPVIESSANMGLKKAYFNIHEQELFSKISENRPFLIALSFKQQVDLIFDRLITCGYQVKKHPAYYDEDDNGQICELLISWEEC